MKNILLLILLSIVPILTSGQAYHKFPTSDDSPIWCIQQTREERVEFDEIIRTISFHYYAMVGDTLIDGENYYKIYQLSDTLISYENIENYVCCIRESDDSCIYRINPGMNDKFKLFDYSLDIGDTTYLHTEAGLMQFQLIQKDRLVLNNDIYTSYIGSFDTWIDGVGSTSKGFDWFELPKPAMVDYYYDLRTFKLDNKLIYGDPFSEYLFEITSLPDANFNNQLLIYPNPCGVNNNLYISSTNLIDKLIIFDIGGNIVMIKDGLGQNKNIVVTTDLKRGSYILRVIDKDGFFVNTKMMIY